MTPSGVLTVLHDFDGTDGNLASAGLIQDTNGSFYGTTQLGGAGSCISGPFVGCGTVYGLYMGLGPFVESQPTSGKIGTSVRILGTNLSGATSVTFNGTGATFKVISGSLISTTVPSGATTGPVQVTLPSGTLTSNVNFQVLP
jgi:hypothetical protein